MSTKDNRYTITKEWCGYSDQKHVVRFCGQWVGQYNSKESADAGAELHSKNRIANFINVPGAI